MTFHQYPAALQRYLEEVEVAKREFGENVVVVFHNGKFYDIYGLDEEGCDVKTVSEVCNTQWFVRDSKDRFWQCGLRTDAIEEKISMLTASGHTVVRMDQVAGTTRTGMQFERSRTKVYSPGVPPQMDDLFQDHSNLLCVVMAKPHARQGVTDAFGYCTVDCFTGESKLTVLRGTEALKRTARRDLPKETLAIGTDLNEDEFGYVRRFVADPVSLEREHMEETLRRVYGDRLGARCDVCAMLNAPADLEWGCAAFVQALHALYRRNDSLLRDMPLPRVYYECDGLKIHADGLLQLGVSGHATVLRCRTAMGQRALRERVKMPCVDASEISGRLDRVDFFKGHPTLTEGVHGELGKVGDINRIGRRMACGGSAAEDLYVLRESLRVLGGVFDKMAEHAGDHAASREMTARLLADLDASVLPDSVRPGTAEPFRRCIFVRGVFPELDEIFDRKNDTDEKIRCVVDMVNGVAGVVPGSKERYFRLEQCCGASEVCTTETRFKKCRWELRKRQFCVRGRTGPSGDIEILSSTTGFPFDVSEDRDLFINGSDLAVTKQGSKTVLRHEGLNGILKERDYLWSESESKMRDCFFEFCKAFHEKNYSAFEFLADAVAELDVSVCAAVQSARRGHVRPRVVDGGAPACLRARSLWHPAFDTVDTSDGSEYVCNDVVLDSDGDRGLLIYGANGSGKSCLMKSVGLAVIMAQAGLHVAAEELVISPFTDIYTRFPRGDDIKRGRSTFVNEMKDVQYMIENAGERWLVIGDEMCSGTNHVGATAVVSAGIHHLWSRACCFMFATHMINVANHVSCLGGVRIQHLSVRRVPGGVEYIRKLCDGTGDVNYTVDVCSGLGFSSEFLELAARFNRLEQGVKSVDYITTTKKSRYNSRVYPDLCEKCGRPADHVHHRTPQAVAPAHKKNRRHNLQSLCEACHAAEHAS